MSADPENPDLLPVAESIADGTAIEWDVVEERLKDHPTLDLLAELHVLDRIAKAHREHATVGATPTATVPAAAETRTWGPFRDLERIGRGSFGAVYRAMDPKLHRDVALKLLDARGGVSSEQQLKEAQLLARVRHANVVAVHGADEHDGQLGIWMEFVKGQTLADLLKARGAFSAREAAVIGLDLCRALAAVHQAGLVHGDIKAHNVMREDGGRTVLMDFGAGRDLTPDSGRSMSLDTAGTPLYLAPEVFAGERQSRATDIYSLGVLLFHLVSGAYPVEGATYDDVERAHRDGPRKHLRDVRPDVPDAFAQAVEHASSPDPRRRFHSAGGFEVALSQFLGASPQKARIDWRRLGAVGALVVGIAGAAYWLTSVKPDTPQARAVSVVPAVPAGLTPSVEPSYTIEAALVRVGESGEGRLESGARVRPGDRLSMRVRVSAPTNVYVINEDDRGESYLLYPLPGQETSNPVGANQLVRLPGARAGQQLFWQVTSAGGREHFIIFASPEPLTTFERLFSSLRRPGLDAPVSSAPLSPEDVGQLRGVGGLKASSVPANSLRLADQFSTPLGAAAEAVRGLWVRRITLMNPL
ncbi:MAG: serine/threonine-protein kinase [Vicinamibacterales bacterium]